MNPWLTILDRCQWSDGALSEPSFATASGYEYGFTGVGDDIPPLYHSKQVHGIVLAEAGVQLSLDKPDVEADGVFTRSSGLTVGVKTADCLPVLLSDSDGSMAQAIHCGWRGLFAGILNEAILAGRSLGIEKGSQSAILGPCIQQSQFEIGSEVARAAFQGDFGLSSEQASLCLTKGKKGDKWYFDLQAAAALNLVNLGLEPGQIKIYRECTLLDHRLHSYRRDGAKSGRNFSWLRLRDDGRPDGVRCFQMDSN